MCRDSSGKGVRRQLKQTLALASLNQTVINKLRIAGLRKVGGLKMGKKLIARFMGVSHVTVDAFADTPKCDVYQKQLNIFALFSEKGRKDTGVELNQSAKVYIVSQCTDEFFFEVFIMINKFSYNQDNFQFQFCLSIKKSTRNKNNY